MCSIANLFDRNIRKPDAKTNIFPLNAQIGKINFFDYKINVLEAEN